MRLVEKGYDAFVVDVDVSPSETLRHDGAGAKRIGVAREVLC